MATLLEDSKLQFAMPAENELRVTYPFANLHISFPTKPDPQNEIIVPAYLKKIDDTFTPTYTPTNVFGRTDPIFTYKQTTRKLKVDFDLPAYNEYDANEILKKINILIKNLYPGYLENRGQYIVNSPPLMRMKFSNLITNPYNGYRGLLGVPDAVAIAHNFTEMSPLVTIVQESAGFVFSRVYTLSLGFSVLHEEIVGWNDGDGSFIANARGEYPYETIPDDLIPQVAKPSVQRAVVSSNLRGLLTNNSSQVRATTLILGGSL